MGGIRSNTRLSVNFAQGNLRPCRPHRPGRPAVLLSVPCSPPSFSPSLPHLEDKGVSGTWPSVSSENHLTVLRHSWHLGTWATEERTVGLTWTWAAEAVRGAGWGTPHVQGQFVTKG